MTSLVEQWKEELTRTGRKTKILPTIYEESIQVLTTKDLSIGDSLYLEARKPEWVNWNKTVLVRNITHKEPDWAVIEAESYTGPVFIMTKPTTTGLGVFVQVTNTLLSPFRLYITV